MYNKLLGKQNYLKDDKELEQRWDYQVSLTQGNYFKSGRGGCFIYIIETTQRVKANENNKTK